MAKRLFGHHNHEFSGGNAQFWASAGNEVVIKIDSVNRRIYIQPASIASPDIDDNFEAHIDAFIDEFRTALDSLANSE